MKKKIYVWIQIIIASALLGVVIGNFVENLPKPEKKAKYIFLFIGDGMGFSHIAATESYLSYKEGKLGGAELLMSTFPYCGFVSTYSANRHVTCSAASGTAIACGEKTINNMIGMNKDSIAIYSTAAVLKKEGYKIGIVSSAPINHATPSAFYAHNISRDNAYDICMDIPASKFDFFAGAGFLDISEEDKKKTPIDEILNQNGYVIGYGVNDFKNTAKASDKAIFCQPSSKNQEVLNYAIEANNTDSSLKEMLELGIEYLGDKEPFFIMCEGGVIDWAAHTNHPVATAQEVIKFDEAIHAAYEFYKNHPEETLIIVTADHETGGLALGTTSKTIKWEPLDQDWEKNKNTNLNQTMRNRELSHECSIGWTSRSHTGGHVPIFAIGAGAEKFSGRMDNTDIKGKILCK